MTARLHPLAVRHQLFLEPVLSEKLVRLARAPGTSKSQILEKAVQAYFDRGEFDALERHFGRRLDRISSQLARIERNGHIELESLALFIRYMLAAVAPVPESDAAGRMVARDRFTRFVTQLGQQLASGDRAFLPGEPG